MEKGRNVTWDYARGIAILMIVLYHLYGYSNRGSGSIPVSICHTVQIPIFMYVSGVLSVSSFERYELGRLLYNRAIRLCLPFISFMLIWMIINPTGFVTRVLDEFKGGYWFVLVLFEITLIAGLAKYIAEKTKTNRLLTILLAFVVMTFYEYFIPRDNVVNRLLSINLVWHYFPFFILGFYHSNLRKYLQLKLSAFYFFGFVALQYYFYMTGNSVALPFCNLLSLLFLMSLFLNNIRPLESLFSYLGIYSLQIYLIHYFLLSLVIPYLPIVENRWLEFFYFMALTFTVIMIAVAISKFLMRSKLLAKFLFGIMDSSHR